MVEREEPGVGLIDVLDRVLDKGIVIDAHVRIALVGVELLAVEARVVVASIQTYLTHADTLAWTPPAARPVMPPETMPPELTAAEPRRPEPNPQKPPLLP
ncbi:MAG TPA: gas vesicle structural protein GvpA [Longimicrobiales bacterium]|nr:gas vesicle structural protein GvpA [Longimicrobiales bacterium]